MKKKPHRLPKLYPVHKTLGITKEQDIKLKLKAKELNKGEGEIIRHLIENYISSVI